MEHPITPPDKLVQQWHTEWFQLKVKHVGVNEYIATQAARWGADQELEACCEWLSMRSSLTKRLRATRRPKPPSLAEQALLAIDTAVADNRISAEIARVTRAALERLQELENGND